MMISSNSTLLVESFENEAYISHFHTSTFIYKNHKVENIIHYKLFSVNKFWSKVSKGRGKIQMFWDRCCSCLSRNDLWWILFWYSWKQISWKLYCNLMLWMSIVSSIILIKATRFIFYLGTHAPLLTNTLIPSLSCGISRSQTTAVNIVTELCTKLTLWLKLSSMKINAGQLRLQSAESYQVTFL